MGDVGDLFRRCVSYNRKDSEKISRLLYLIILRNYKGLKVAGGERGG